VEGIDYDWQKRRRRAMAGHEKRFYEVITAGRAAETRSAWGALDGDRQVLPGAHGEGRRVARKFCFIGSRRCSARQYAKVLRNHWGIENGLHWQMDITFGRDASRFQKRHGGENFAYYCAAWRWLLKQHPGKGSIRCKRYQAAMDVEFLEECSK